MFEQRGVPYKVLGFYSSTVKNIADYASRYNIEYLVINTHGYWKIKEADKPRTILFLDDGKVISDKVSNYQQGAAAGVSGAVAGQIRTNAPTWRSINFQDLRLCSY